MQRQKGIFGIFEITVIFTILFLLDLKLKYFGYVNVEPNPYLIFTIFIAIRYGIRLVLFSTALSTFYTLFSLYIFTKENFISVVFSWEILKIPIFILSFGFIVGFFRDLYVHEIYDKENEIKYLKKKNNELYQTLQKQNILIKDLENKLLLSREFSPLLIRKLKTLRFDNLENILNEAFDTIDRLLAPKSFSIYSLSKNNFLRLKLRKGESKLPNSFPIENSYLISKAMNFGFADIKSLIFEEELLNKNFHEPLMVSAIYFSGKEENLYGFLIIEDIEEAKINKNTEIYLKMLSDWLGTLIQNALNLSNEYDLVFEDIEKFNEILNELENRRKRFNIPYSVVIAKTLEKIPINELRKFIRETDFLFYDGKNLKLILTASDSNGLAVFLNRLKENKNIEILEAYSKEWNQKTFFTY